MKRSKIVVVTAIMLTMSVAACDGIDDRTASNSRTGSTVQQSFNFEEEKKLRISCDKPEDFSLPECHDKKQQQPNSAVAASSSSTRTHSSFIFMPMFWNSGYSGGGYAPSRNYGPSNASAKTYSSARQAVTGSGLASTYRASTVPASSISNLGSVGRSIATRSAVAGISRGGFGGTGRAIAAATSAHSGAVSGS